MKISKVVLVGILVMTSQAMAQSKSDVFVKEVPVTWLGLDFSYAKLLGDRERLGSESDVRHLIDAWNDLILAEPDKFDIAKAIGRVKVENEIQITKEHNVDLDVISMFSDEEKDYLHTKVSDVEELIAGYDFKDLSGIGLMFNVESFNKINVEGSVWITFINLSTKEVLFTERIVAPPTGMGLRNYWAGCIYEILTKIRKKEFEMWRKKHYRP
jgi:hypothetical protein